MFKKKTLACLTALSLAGIFAACTQALSPADLTDEDDSEEIAKTDDSSDSQGNSSNEENSSSSVEVDSSAISSDSTDDSDDSDNSDDNSSSSEADAIDSSSSEVTSSAAEGETSTIGDNDASIGRNDMEEISEEEKDKLNDLKEALENGENPSGFDKADSTNFKVSDLDFDNNDYYCFFGENQWLKISIDNLKASGLPFLWNGAAYGLQRKYTLRFEGACSAIYVQRK